MMHSVQEVICQDVSSRVEAGQRSSPKMVGGGAANTTKSESVTPQCAMVAPQEQQVFRNKSGVTPAGISRGGQAGRCASQAWGGGQGRQGGEGGERGEGREGGGGR